MFFKIKEEFIPKEKITLRRKLIKYRGIKEREEKINDLKRETQSLACQI